MQSTQIVTIQNTKSAQYLRTSLNRGMHGIEQMPALYFNMSFALVDQLNLSRYKSLQDISNCMKSIQEGL